MDFIGFYQQHVEGLKKAGKQYLGYCPFHSDKGSKMKGFSVNPDDGLWYCFSCGEGGGAVKFCKKKGIPYKDAPDYDPQYTKYAYQGGAVKKKPVDKNKNPHWEGAKGTIPANPYNHQAIEMARKEKRTLWICEGEKDTLTMWEAGEMAIGIPTATGDKTLNDVSLIDIPEVIIVTDKDKAGEGARERILARFPFAQYVEWPEGKRKGYDVTDHKNKVGEGFIGDLKTWAIDEDPFSRQSDYLYEKYAREKDRDPEELLGYKLTNFKSLAGNIDGVQPGFYVVGADTSVGKTAFLCNLTLDLLDSNQDLVGIYFTFDDPIDPIINRYLSIKTGIELNQVQKKQSGEDKQKLEGAYRYLADLTDSKRLFIRDFTQIKDIEDLECEIKRRMNRKLFVVIDALYNLDIGDVGDQRKENIERANKLKSLAGEYKIPLICTGELRKKGQEQSVTKTPSVHDLMETGKFAYNANLVLLIYPKDYTEYDREDDPILQLKYAKNKLSHYRMTDELQFYRSTSILKEHKGMGET